MRIVTYSLSISGPPQRTDYHEQLLSSVKSLRFYNRVVVIHVFLYGEHPHVFIAELEREGVTVHQMGSYEEAIRRFRPRAFRSFVRYPVVHKWMNFRKLAAFEPSQILLVDCDTYFFDDVEILFDRYADCHYYGREEPSSKASHFGYDPHYLDEEKLYALARREGATPMNPYNIGVSILNHGLWNEIAKRTTMFFDYAFRFIGSMARNPETRGRLWPELAEVVLIDLLEQPDVSELPFPSSNVWIIEQVALWLTLGHVPGLTHGHISREHVRQGDEVDESETKVVHHYFGMDKTAFLTGMTTRSILQSL